MDNFVITIARGFGSGGKSIALELSKRMGIPCYENEILDMASDASGINKALFHETDERLRGSLFAKMLKGIPTKTILAPSEKDFVSDINLFNLQAQIIRSLALSQSCIIVGKCADHVLEYFDNVYRIYIDAPRPACVKSIVDKMCVSEAEANRLISKRKLCGIDRTVCEIPDEAVVVFRIFCLGRKACRDFFYENRTNNEEVLKIITKNLPL